MKTWLTWVLEQLKAIGPYFALELVLPGGTLIALALWLYRHRSVLAQRQEASR
jgi:hypothetical protein